MHLLCLLPVGIKRSLGHKWLEQKKASKDLLLPSGYPITQWLKHAPHRWEIPVQIISPLQAEKRIDPGPPTSTVSSLTTGLKGIKEPVLKLPIYISHHVASTALAAGVASLL